MDWRVLIIPLIPLAIWIILTIFRSMEETKDKGTPSRDGESRPPKRAQPARRAVSDRERFEQEARARRTVSRANREPTPARPRADDVPKALPIAAVPRARPVEAPRPAAPLPVAKPVIVPKAEPEPMPAPPPVPVAKVTRPVSALGERLKTMLRDKDALKAAVVLQEILGPPACRRR